MAWQTEYKGKEALEFLRRVEAGEVCEEECLAVLKIDLSSLSLKKIPYELRYLKNLTALDVSRNNLDMLPDWLGCLTNLTALDVSSNNLGELPDWLGGLTNLTVLDVSWNDLGMLPDWLGGLTNLTALNVSRNNLGMLPYWLGYLTNLTALDVSRNGLGMLPFWLGCLTNLTAMGASRNNLDELPDWLGGLTNLTVLDVSWNDLGMLPDWLGGLTNLTALDVGGNNLKELPDSLGSLTNLTVLDVSANRLTELPDSLGNLTNLTALGVSRNYLSELPDSLSELKNLSKLDLSDLKLKEISPSLVLTLLDRGVVFDIFIKDHIKNPKIVLLSGTTLRDQPIDLFLSNDAEKIRAYCREQINAKSISLCKEGKIIFLGDGAAGKTYTIKRLLQLEEVRRGNAAEEPIITTETPGVDISDWYPVEKDHRFRIWDFGGQECLYSLHRCFLTDECLYVIIIRTRLSSLSPTEQARNWLNVIKTYAPNSKVLLAVNIEQGTPVYDAGLSMSDLRGNFPELVNSETKVLAYCAVKEDGDRFNELRDAIFAAAEILGSLGREMLESVVKIKNALEAYPEDIISKEEYDKICDNAGLDRENSETYLDWFQQLGICFKYKNNEDMRVLNPLWITKAAYGIIRRVEQNPDAGEKGANQHGIISHHVIGDILTELDSEKYPKGNDGLVKYILGVLRNYELSYKFEEGSDGRDSEFLPALCPNGSADVDIVDSSEKLEVRREYGYISEGTIYQLMVKLRKMLVLSYCFKREFRINNNMGLDGVIRFEGTPITKIKIMSYDIDGNAAGKPWQLISCVLKEIDSILGKPERDELIYEPDADTQAVISLPMFRDAIHDGDEYIRAEIKKGRGETAKINISDIVNMTHFSSERKLDRLDKKMDILQECEDMTSENTEAILLKTAGIEKTLADTSQQIEDLYNQLSEVLGKNEEEFRQKIIAAIENSPDEAVRNHSDEVKEKKSLKELLEYVSTLKDCAEVVDFIRQTATEYGPKVLEYILKILPLTATVVQLTTGAGF